MHDRRDRSPYTAAAGVPPPKFAGRRDILEHFADGLEDLEHGVYAHPSAVVGARGVGKTVLLGELETIAQERGWRTATFEIQRRQRLEQQLVGAINEITTALAPTRAAIRTFRDRVAAATSLEISTSAISPVQVSWNVSAEREPKSYGADIETLASAAAELARDKHSGCAIFIDELHESKGTELEVLAVTLQALAKRREHVPFQVTGAGLPSLIREVMDAGTYGERMFKLWDLEPLTLYETAEALRDPARSRGRDYEDATIEAIYGETEGYPYFIQCWGQEVWRLAAASTMTPDDVEKARPNVYADLDRSFFRMRTDRLSGREREYVNAMAHLPRGTRSSKDIAAALGLPYSTLSVIRDRLIAKGVITATRYGYVEFTAPGHDAYLIRQESGPSLSP